jgi:aspartate/methionine/tyrosine aminotransferase/prephenate dehydratase/prephenate dehydrogenase
MKVGYQGIRGSYSEEALIQLVDDDCNLIPIKDFDLLFNSLNNNNIDFAFIPMENSIGNSLYMNYDYLIKYNLIINAEYNLPINHCLITNKDCTLENLEFITSDPQAVIQCSNFIENSQMKSQDFFDTAGAVKFIKENKSKNVAAIASKKSAEIYDMKILKENIQDKNINFTRFLLLSKNKNNFLGNFITNKISVAFSLKDNNYTLADALKLFSFNGINISKIESKPYNDNYLFYVDIKGNILKNNCKDAIKQLKDKSRFFKNFGNYPSINPNEKLERKLNIGIIGFGRFGQFLSKYLSEFHNIVATSRSDYTEIAKDMNITFIQEINEFIKNDFDIIIFCVSIMSFEKVIKSIPNTFLENKLIIDVLSVKNMPKNVMLNLDIKSDILCTHPMFGPDSADNSWKDLPFVYEKVRISNKYRCDIFLDFFRSMGCKMIELDCKNHDNYSTNSQFITHLTGRILKQMEIKSTPINTKGYNHLLEIMKNTCNDNFELFKGLYNFNENSDYILNKLVDSINEINKELNDNINNDKDDMFDDYEDIFFEKINKYKKNNINFIDFSVSEPKFSLSSKIKDDISSIINNIELGYTKTEGISLLREKICEYLNNFKNLNYQRDEIICTNGSKYAIFLILYHLCINKNSEIIIPTPCWKAHVNSVKLVGATPVFFETKSDNMFQLDINKLEELITKKTKAIILCNPNNPTGIIYNKQTLDGIAYIAKKYKIFVISDEVYEMFDFYNSHISLASLEDMKNYTFTVNGFSKGFGLPGIRLGYIAAPKKHVNRIKKIQANITTCPNIISQYYGVILLENLNEYKKLGLEIEKVCNFLYNSIIKLPNIKCHYPNGSLFLFPDISFYINKTLCGQKIKTSTDFCELLLQNFNIGVSPGDNFYASNHIRISYDIDMNKAIELVKRLHLVFNNSEINLV